MKFSKRLKSMQASPIRKLAPFAAQAKSDGVKVYHLNIGQPDIKTPECFFKAVKNFNEPVLEYAGSQGLPELINALQKYYETYDMHFSKDDFLVTNGGSEALLFTFMAICDPGDNILIPEPFYTNYNGFGQSINMEVKPITTKAEDGFHLPPKEKIVALIDEKTKGILVSNPGNVKEIEDRCVIIDSVSKRYSACGARIGSIACKNAELIGEIMKLCQGRLCIATLEQLGAAALFNETPASYLKQVNEEYCKRRDTLYNELMKADGVICKKPMGAFYIVAKLPVDNAEDFVKWMLTDFRMDNATVMATPAEGFYATHGLGRDEVRLAYILKEEDLKVAGKLLAEGLKAYKTAMANA